MNLISFILDLFAIQLVSWESNSLILPSTFKPLGMFCEIRFIGICFREY
jgi:hypothetical protein